MHSKRGKETERYAVRGREMLWKLRCSVKDPNYGIFLRVPLHKMITEKDYLVY